MVCQLIKPTLIYHNKSGRQEIWKMAVIIQDFGEVGQSGIKAFYVYGENNTDTIYGCYSSIDEKMYNVGYGKNQVIVDDDNITINKNAAHGVTITFKKDGYLVIGTTSGGTSGIAETTPELKTAGSTYTHSTTYTISPIVAYFI